MHGQGMIFTLTFFFFLFVNAPGGAVDAVDDDFMMWDHRRCQPRPCQMFFMNRFDAEAKDEQSGPARISPFCSILQTTATQLTRLERPSPPRERRGSRDGSFAIQSPDAHWLVPCCSLRYFRCSGGLHLDVPGSTHTNQHQRGGHQALKGHVPPKIKIQGPPF
ncbi:unnamed protein product [Durusdinium trenchii]|uniref:Secreted protein n=1 Tax=Durusdinium trenchii TaxID=1381693 RepID=A0ABP0PPE4_9DINO